MRTKTRSTAAGTFLAAILAVIVSVPVPASAAEGIKTEYYKLYPSLKLIETYESNIFQTAEDEVDDYVTTIQPALKVYFPYQNHFLQLEGEAAFNLYADNGDDADNSTWKAGGALGGNYPGGLSFLLGDRFTHGWVQSQSGFTVAEYVDYNQAYGNVGFAVRDDLKVELQYFNYDFAYDETDDLDRQENTVSLTLFYRVFPKTSALLEVAWSGIAYDEAGFAYKDNTVWQARAGVKWAATGRTTGEVRIGWQGKEYDEEALEDVDTFVVSAPFSYTISRSTILEVEVFRATLESDYTDNPYTTSTGVRADLSHKLTGKITATAGMGYTAFDYANVTTEEEQTAERSDDLLRGRLKLAFQMYRWLELGAEGVTERYDSNLDRFDWVDTKVTVSATAAF